MAAQPRWLRSLLQLLTPTLLLSHIRQEFQLKGCQPAKLHGTSYLDGLRGLAALAVFGQHYTDYNLKSLQQWFFTSYYSASTSSPTSPLQLPYARILYGGPVTHIFFVVSGFALALRPMGELHPGEEDEQGGGDPPRSRSRPGRCRCRCRAMLASAAIRRPVRLWGPCLALTLPLAFLSRRVGHFRHYIAREETQWLQVRHWGRDFFGRVAVWPWAWPGAGAADPLPRPRYNVHLWTVPVELAHSYLLFFVVLVLSRLRPRLRVPFVAAVMAGALHGAHWTAFEFLAGCLLAVLHLRQNAGRRQQQGGPCWRLLAKVVPATSLLVMGFVASWPTYMIKAPWPYSTLAQYVPSATKKREESEFWFALAAASVVWGMGQVAVCRRFLERPLVQYLGRVSFVFYIVQHPFLNLFQGRLMGEAPREAYTDGEGTEYGAEAGHGLKRWPGVHTGTRLTFTWILGWAILVPVELLVSDYLTRLIDWPCARAARSIERFICDDTGSCANVENDAEKRLRTASGLHRKEDEDGTESRFSLPS
ncbi:hypothetical protein SLS62_001421 [Diatrype stigma]|uniref:Acyltransferase 3 domain-containing protein n=1 Tax=Diatrype stigma TaxID=117547 RepID=A0AAN9V8M8_9PEZI